MRYYSITLSDPVSGKSLVQDGSGGFTLGSGPTFTSLAKNALPGQIQSDPGALNIEFDFPIYHLAKSEGGQRVKIWGVGLKALSQASNLAGLNFSMKAGMSPGLPLADSAQAGIVFQGKIFTSYGNWQGVNQTLDLVINPGMNDSIFSIPIPFWWPAGTPLDTAIDNALSQSFPGFKTEIFIDSGLTLANDEAGYYANFSQFASYLNGITANLGSQTIANYPGVQIVVSGDTINVFDGENASGGPASINVPMAFQDLIGQPTWIGPNQVQFNTVLRADISVGNTITFPTGILTPYALTSPAAAVPLVPASSRSVFQGKFLVQNVHFFGNFRDPDADSWVTAFIAAAK